MKFSSVAKDEDLTALKAQFSGATGGAGVDFLGEKADAARVIVEGVRERGDDAVAEFTAEFDGVSLRPEQFELSRGEIEEAADSVDRELYATLERAHGQILDFHGKNLRRSWEEELEDGTVLGQRIMAIASAGVYVPGGTAYYPSSVLMNVIPARVAGVKEIVMVSPPSYEGSIHPVVLAAARIAGVSRVFRIGGAQAIAALAFGTERVPKVLKITGPGNTYVTAAKGLIQPYCDIDTEAGPSEVTVIADEHATPSLVAAELLAQAEHDEEACCILLTPSKKLAKEVEAILEVECRTLSRGAIIGVALERNGSMVVTRDLDEAVDLANTIAPEHLAIYTEYPRIVFEKIENAGAIMLGETTSVVLGDYYAGPNHILPTGRRARFASPLSAEDFLKVSSVISFSSDRVRRTGEDIIRLALTEGLTAHARAIELRQ